MDERQLERGHREYRVQVTLTSITTRITIGQGVGSCSTMENKYQFYKNRYLLENEGVVDEMQSSTVRSQAFVTIQTQIEANNVSVPSATVLRDTDRQVSSARDQCSSGQTATSASMAHPSSMTIAQKIELMTVRRNHAGVPTTSSFLGTVEERREMYCGLEAEGLVKINGPKQFPESNWSDVYSVTLTPKGREFLREHWRPIPAEPTACELLNRSGAVITNGLCQDTHLKTDPAFAAPDALLALTPDQINDVATLRLASGLIVPIRDFRAHHGTHYHFRIAD